jgi:acetyltransferase-like isoleucine patch superfamily enzyme
MIRDKILFRLNHYWDLLCVQLIRKVFLALEGSKISISTRIPKMSINWPHQLSIGSHCTLEDNLIFKYDSVWKKGPNILIGNNVFIGNNTEFNISERITIGHNSLIASYCRFVDHDHGMSDLKTLIRLQESTTSPIVIEENVWIGSNCTILKGVSIGKGAVIGAGSVLNKSVPPNEVWAGVPAKLIRKR